jgi:WD40 repeat protein
MTLLNESGSEEHTRPTHELTKHKINNYLLVASAGLDNFIQLWSPNSNSNDVKSCIKTLTHDFNATVSH